MSGGPRRDSRELPDPRVGLCSICRHARTVRSDRGSLFHLCERARTDSSFALYPWLPVTECKGFEAVREAGKRDPDT